MCVGALVGILMSLPAGVLTRREKNFPIQAEQNGGKG